MKPGKLQLLLTGICLGCSAGAAEENELMKSALDAVRGSSFYGHTGTTIGSLFNNYRPCTRPVWEEHSGELGSGVTFSCELPCSFKESLPAGLQALLTGPAFTRQLRADFGISQNRSNISLEYLGLGYDYIFPWHEASPGHPVSAYHLKMLDALSSQDDFALSLAEVLSPDSGVHAKLKEAARQAVLAYGTSLKTSLPGGKRYWFYAKERGCFSYLEAESFAWDQPAAAAQDADNSSAAAALSGSAVISLTDTDLTPEQAAEHLRSQGIDPWMQDLPALLNAGAPEFEDLSFQKSQPRRIRCSGSLDLSEFTGLLTRQGSTPQPLLGLKAPAGGPELELTVDWDPATAAAALKLPAGMPAPYNPPAETARHSELPGHPGLTAGELFSGLKDCMNPRWESSADGKEAFFSCSLPLRGLDRLPPDFARMLQAPEFRSLLQAHFEAAADGHEFVLKQLLLTPPGASEASLQPGLTPAALLAGAEVAPDPVELLAAASPEARAQNTEAAGRAAAAYATAQGALLPRGQKLWFYPEEGECFHYLEPHRISWQSSGADLNGSAEVTLTRTDLSADRLAAHLRSQGIDPYLQDLLALLNADAPEVRNVPFTTAAPQNLEYHGSWSTAALLQQLLPPGSTASAAASSSSTSSAASAGSVVFMPPAGAPAGSFVLDMDLDGRFYAASPASAPYTNAAEQIRHSFLEGFQGKNAGEIFDGYPYAENRRWEISGSADRSSTNHSSDDHSSADRGSTDRSSAATVSFSCEIPFRFREKLPPELTEQLHGPAFSQILTAQFGAPAADGILALPVLSLGYGGNFRILKDREARDTLRTLFYQEELISSLGTLINSDELPAARRTLKELLHSHFTAPGVSLPLKFSRVLDSGSSIYFLKNIDSFEWMPLDDEENFEGIVSLSLVDTGLSRQTLPADPSALERLAAAAAAPESGKTAKLWRYSCRSAPEFFQDRIRDLDGAPGSLRNLSCVPLDDATDSLELKVEWDQQQPRPALQLKLKPQSPAPAAFAETAEPASASAAAASTAVASTAAASTATTETEAKSAAVAQPEPAAATTAASAPASAETAESETASATASATQAGSTGSAVSETADTQTSGTAALSAGTTETETTAETVSAETTGAETGAATASAAQTGSTGYAAAETAGSQTSDTQALSAGTTETTAEPAATAGSDAATAGAEPLP